MGKATTVAKQALAAASNGFTSDAASSGGYSTLPAVKVAAPAKRTTSSTGSGGSTGGSTNANALLQNATSSELTPAQLMALIPAFAKAAGLLTSAQMSKQAAATAAQEQAPTLQAIQDAILQDRQQTANAQASTTAGGQALAALLQPVAGQDQAAFNNAASADSGYASGITGTLGSLLQNAAANQASNLSTVGGISPDQASSLLGTSGSNPNSAAIASNADYLHGFLPANALNGAQAAAGLSPTGGLVNLPSAGLAAYNAALQMPANAVRAAQQGSADLGAQNNQAVAALQQKLAETSAGTPGLVNSALAALQQNNKSAQSQAIAEASLLSNAGSKVAGTTISAAKTAAQIAQAAVTAGLKAAGITQKGQEFAVTAALKKAGLNEQYAKLSQDNQIAMAKLILANKKLAQDAKTANSKSKNMTANAYGSLLQKAHTMADDFYYGIPAKTSASGAVTAPAINPVEYGQALSQLLSIGVKLPDALNLLNAFYAPGEGGRPASNADNTAGGEGPPAPKK